jgi:hypothetical protein
MERKNGEEKRSPPTIRWSSKPSKPLLNLPDEIDRDYDEIKYAPLSRRVDYSREKNTRVDQMGFKPVSMDNSGTRIVRKTREFLPRKFSPTTRQYVGKNPLVKPVFDILNEGIEDSDINERNFIRNTNELSSTNYLFGKNNASNQRIPASLLAKSNPSISERRRLNEEDAKQLLKISGGLEYESKKKFTYPCLGYLGDGSLVSILYGTVNKLYLVTKSSKLITRFAGGVARKDDEGKYRATILDPRLAYHIDFRENPIYLIEGNENTALTTQKIDDMESNSIFTDFETLNGEDLRYPEYIEILRARGKAATDDLPNSEFLSTVIENYFKI